jgi:aspartyl-tRNA(Asn)/glutamyl-tRNA(Gln) amidotransferase subunit A
MSPPPPPDSALAIADAVRRGAQRAADLTRAALEAIDAANPRLNAFTQVFREAALARAEAIDARAARGEPLGPLAGVPIAVKDNICTVEGLTTCASRMLAAYRSPFDAEAVRRLLDADAVIVGKTNLDEFAMGGSGEHSCFGPTRNPWDPQRVPGGSSSGSAAAVAAGLVPVALGSDTGGSIRQPAGLCGLHGLKPTYGRVSRRGLVAFASSLDQIGPMARTAEDLALVAQVIAGHDPGDSTCARLPPEDWLGAALGDAPPGGLRVGVARHARSPRNHPGVNAALDDAVETLHRLGVRTIDIDLPHTDLGIAAYYLIATAEASSNLARYDGVRYGHRAAPRPGDTLADLYARSRSEGFGPEVQRRIMLGTHVLSAGYYDAYYLTAQKARRLIKGDYDRAFADGCDAVLMPVAPTPAFRLGEKVNDPLALYLEDVYTVGVNLAGLPGLAFPAGFTQDGGRTLPVGLQFIGPALGERVLFRLAGAFQRATSFADRRPDPIDPA